MPCPAHALVCAFCCVLRDQGVTSGSCFRELIEGRQVTFEVTQGQKGPQAENITVA
ncbi:cold shock domain-containing protein [Streptomyces griseoluteus]|uniref:cold shock domain-containing protein n=1 Tax=Streptomyces griseoluteus TaxID=29306 RepID=UPI0036F89AE8